MGEETVSQITDVALLSRILHMSNSGVLPKPILGESLDTYAIRTAHAGALIALQLVREDQAQQQADDAVAEEVDTEAPSEG